MTTTYIKSIELLRSLQISFPNHFFSISDSRFRTGCHIHLSCVPVIAVGKSHFSWGICLLVNRLVLGEIPAFHRYISWIVIVWRPDFLCIVRFIWPWTFISSLASCHCGVDQGLLVVAKAIQLGVDFVFEHIFRLGSVGLHLVARDWWCRGEMRHTVAMFY